MTVADRGHAALDLASRRVKAEKVAELLGLVDRSVSLRILEIGCGSGGIAHYFATQPAGHQVDAVDVYDSRVVRDGYTFQIVTGTDLPFAEATFDVVISNHVVEHVGSREDQISHLSEICRVMRPNGVGYLAAPNRWRLIEPHYRVPLLSVLPERFRSPYLRLVRHHNYDCLPPSSRDIERMFTKAGLLFVRLGSDALKVTLRIERPGSLATRLANRTPDRVLVALQPAMPSLVYRLNRGGSL